MPKPTVVCGSMGAVKARPPVGSLMYLFPSSEWIAREARCQPGWREGGYGLER